MTVNEALRTAQTAALDVRDAVVALQRLYALLQVDSLQPEAGQALHSALEHGAALVHTFEVIGMYDPVPIEML